MRGVSIARNAAGNYNFYCRSCGTVHEQDEMPTICKWCGNILTEDGIGVSGDGAGGETSASDGYPGRGRVITNIDKKIR